MTAIVYSAIYGDYDALKQPANQDADCEFVCFTDAKLPARVGAWHIVRSDLDRDAHPRLRAKRYKLLSHQFFPNGRWKPAIWSRARNLDLSIWVDGSLEIESASFVSDMRARLLDSDWAMFVHPDRDDLYEEAELSASLPKYRSLPIREQAESYRNLVPSHSGLFACGVIVRREPVSERLQTAAHSWWDENVKWTYQDQLSLPYVWTKHPGTRPAAIAEPLRHNQWFRIRKHVSAL